MTSVAAAGSEHLGPCTAAHRALMSSARRATLWALAAVIGSVVIGCLAIGILVMYCIGPKWRPMVPGEIGGRPPLDEWAARGSGPIGVLRGFMGRRKRKRERHVM